MVRLTQFVAAGSRHSSALMCSSREEMMCCCFLLLLTLTSCVCEPTFVVKVTQSSYQAEENHNITLDWTFTNNTQGSSELLSVNCELLTEDRESVVYHLREGDEESQDEQFSGRVQCDRDVLREGRVRLHVSRLRTEDSGWYQCVIVKEDDRRGSDVCPLNVTAERPGPEGPGPERPGPERPGPEGPGPEGPGPESHGGISVGLYVGLVLGAAGLSVLLLVKLRSFLKSKLNQLRPDLY